MIKSRPLLPYKVPDLKTPGFLHKKSLMKTVVMQHKYMITDPAEEE
jgi:hypothetical protein